MIMRPAWRWDNRGNKPYDSVERFGLVGQGISLNCLVCFRLTESVADESALSHLRYELSVGAERDCLVHVSDCALPLSDDLCRVVPLGDRRSVRRAFRKTQCEQQRDARQSNGAHDARHLGCAICPSQPPYYGASRPWPRAPPHGTCGGCLQCSRAWVAAASPSHPWYRR